MDLFDRLQDELLEHIVSFLPTKYAVATSLLSRRWKFLWCYADKLAFDDSISFHGIREDVGYYEEPRVLAFNNFVDKALELNKAPRIESFILKIYSNHWTPNPVPSWLDHIVHKRHAKEIEVHFSLMACLGIDFTLSDLNSASLRVLKLHCGLTIDLSGVNKSNRFFLPNLKVLHFWMDKIRRKWWLLSALFRDCPLLEEAYFGGNLRDNRHTTNFCNIYAPSLKRLRMIFRYEESSNKFLINAPILEDLVVVDESFQHHVVKSNRLVNAKLDIGNFEGHYKHRVCKLLCRISNVKFLNLKGQTMDALSMCCESMNKKLPQFHTLCHLKLCFLNYSSWDVIPTLLECAPNLQALAISKDFKSEDIQFRRDAVWIQPSSVPVCLLSSLCQVEVWDCESHLVEFNLINYLLEHGDVLSTFVVELLPADLWDDLRFREKLMSIPRVSKTCELKVSVYPHRSQHRGSSADQENNRHLTKLQQRMLPQKLCFEDLRVCTDYFSENQLIMRTRKFKIYRGKLYQSSRFGSPFTDVVVKKWLIEPMSRYDEHYKELSVCNFREEIKLLQHPNFKHHPYFASLVSYCAEDYNERLGVVYDFKPMDCLENLIPKDSFSWLQRIKVALVLACISEYMLQDHEEMPCVAPRLHPSSIFLDEDYMPKLFHFCQRSDYLREEDRYDDICAEAARSNNALGYGLLLLGLISKSFHRCPVGTSHTSLGLISMGFHRCPVGTSHTSKCRTMSDWARMQLEDRDLSYSLCKSQIPLVHRSLMDDPTYDIVDGLKLTRLALRCADSFGGRPSTDTIVKYLCKLRVVRENWDALDGENILANTRMYYY